VLLGCPKQYLEEWLALGRMIKRSCRPLPNSSSYNILGCDGPHRTTPDAGARRRLHRLVCNGLIPAELGDPRFQLEKHRQSRNKGAGAAPAVHTARHAPSARRHRRTSSRRSSRAATLAGRAPALVAADPAGALKRALDELLPGSPEDQSFFDPSPLRWRERRKRRRTGPPDRG
jgi:hypothetical protein